MKTKSVFKMLVIAGVTTGLTVFYVLTENSQRQYPSIEDVERTISFIEIEITKASQQDDLPPLSETWRSIKTIAALYDVKVNPLERPEDAGISTSDIPGGTPWFGVLQGKTKNVSIAAMEIQKSVPIIFGAAALDNDLIGMSFAALGSTHTSN